MASKGIRIAYETFGAPGEHPMLPVMGPGSLMHPGHPELCGAGRQGLLRGALQRPRRGAVHPPARRAAAEPGCSDQRGLFSAAYRLGQADYFKAADTVSAKVKHSHSSVASRARLTIRE